MRVLPPRISSQAISAAAITPVDSWIVYHELDLSNGDYYFLSG